jgi:hypothetical protein
MNMVFGLVVSMVLFVTPAFATTQFLSGTGYQTTALTGYATSGSMMDGMTVTVTFGSGSTSTALWADIGLAAGAATGAGWSLSQSGDTYGGTWLLNSDVAITKLFIDAGTGNTVFDIMLPNDNFGTNGSARGWHINDNNSVTYKDSVALTGSDPVGDLFRTLQIDFSQQVNSYSFITDTDNLRLSGDLNPVVPEPSTVALLGLGLAGIAFMRKRIRR